MNKLIVENKTLQDQNRHLLIMNESLAKTQTDIGLLLSDRKGKNGEAALASAIRDLLDENIDVHVALSSFHLGSNIINDAS